MLIPQDVNAFNGDIGAAQVYFINEVYSRLKVLHPDIKFMVVPMDYSQTGNYGDKTTAGLRLRQFQKLPLEIGIYSVSYYDEDVLAATFLTGRPSVAVVSNFYSEGIEDRNEYAVPYLNFIGWQDSAVRGQDRRLHVAAQDPAMRGRRDDLVAHRGGFRLGAGTI